MTEKIKYTADSGKTFIRTSDSKPMGHVLIMGVNDSIDNYEEADLTEENDVEGLLERETKIKKLHGKL